MSDIETINKPKINISPNGQKAVDAALKALRNDKFPITLRPIVDNLILGFLNPASETFQDMYNNGETLRVIRIPFFKREYEVFEASWNNFISQKASNGEVDDTSGIAMEAVGQVLSQIRDKNFLYRGIQPVLKHDGGGEKIDEIYIGFQVSLNRVTL